MRCSLFPLKKVLVLSSFVLLSSAAGAQKKYIDWVDPFIGTGGHGHTYPGATVPFGMVQLSPDNGDQGWDWCSGYHYSSDSIAGFSHTHLSGTGIGDWCDISVMPATELLPAGKAQRVHFSHQNEKASPGFYSVQLGNGIKADFTTTERCGLHQYTFPAGSTPVIRFDLGFRINWDNPTETFVQQVNDSTLVGYRYSKGWAGVQRVYFAARTSAPITSVHVSDGEQVVEGAKALGKKVQAQMLFAATSKPILMKVALSSVSADKAMLALGEIDGWNFNAVKAKAENKWERELAKVQIRSTDEKLKRIFYSALYHTCLAPVLYSDADGAYQNAKGNVLKMPSGNRYTVYSLWDTFRALNPLFTVTQPERIKDIINSMLAFYEENGQLPVWDLSTWETNTMTGYHAIPVVADAILKDVKGIDVQKAYTAMKKSAMQNTRGTDVFRQYGYVPQDKYGSSVTVTVEYAYDDWCIAQVAKKLGNTADYNEFMKRSSYWKNLLDSSTGFIRAKNSDGKWVEPFDPFYSEHDEHKAMYTEGNAWQHSFFVPHNIRGLSRAQGGNAKLVQKLDELFSVSSKMTGENQSPDVSGFIGQYAHGNEPSHHIAYMYTFLGAPWKTQEKVRLIVDSMYHDRPDGYAGNEDCGQMSAWGVWSIMGLYPANPASSQYVLGCPMLEEARLALPGNRSFVIRAKGIGKDAPYIQQVRLNGKPYSKTYIDHQTLLRGGVLEITMGKTPNKQWGAQPASWPASAEN